MANYPNSVTTFTTKSDGAGNTIQAAHINDLQNEVTAIEDGLLNGTAPVNSSRITAASLNVAGNSTVAGAFTAGASTLASISVAGGSTVSGAAVFTGGLTASGAAGMLVSGPFAATTALRLGVSTVTIPSGESTGLNVSAAPMWLMATSGGSTAVVSTITGLIHASRAQGQIVGLLNTGSPTIHIAHTGSSAASTNQIVTPLGVTIRLRTHESATFMYDGTNWRTIAQAQSTQA